MPEDEKKRLSELYTGTRGGKNNPVHKIIDRDSWKLSVSRGNEGKLLPDEQKDKLKKPEHWKHLLNCELTEEGFNHKRIVSKYNNSKYRWVYFYRGDVYLSPKDLPDSKHQSSILRSSETVILEIPHPKVDILVADGEGFPLWFKITQADEARQQGLHGVALLEALGR